MSLSILLINCNPNDKKNNSIEGIWKSIGYGNILKIDSTTFKYFDITNISCLPSKQVNISEVKNSIAIKNDTLAGSFGFVCSKNGYNHRQITKYLSHFLNLQKQ